MNKHLLYIINQLSYNKMVHITKLDKKTIEKILRGEQVNKSTLVKLKSNIDIRTQDRTDNFIELCNKIDKIIK